MKTYIEFDSAIDGAKFAAQLVSRGVSFSYNADTAQFTILDMLYGHVKDLLVGVCRYTWSDTQNPAV